MEILLTKGVETIYTGKKLSKKLTDNQFLRGFYDDQVYFEF